MQPDEMIADLMSTSGDRLLRLAYQLCHDRTVAEDLMQEAPTRVYGNWLRRKPDVEFAEAYVRRAIVNEYLRTRRNRASTEVITSEPPEVAVGGFEHGGFEQDVAEHDSVWRALEGLPARQRAVLVLRYYADLPDAEIAELIGARVGTVRSLASRGLAALRVEGTVQA